MGTDDDAPEMDAPETPENPPDRLQGDRLPDDHPLVTSLGKVKAEREELRSELKALRDRDKSESEKLTDRITEAEQRAAAAEQALMRAEVAAAKGLTPAQAKRLAGVTREELEADADELLETFGAKEEDERPPGRPTERLRSGTQPEAEPSEDIRQIVESIPRGF